MSSESRPQVHVVFNTHWDREWLQPFSQYRFRLVRLFDHLLDILEKEPGLTFYFDGQTVVLEDYLEARPDQRERIVRLGGAGRLRFGPWYVLADQFLEGPEATLRNLQTGMEIASQFGGAVKFGYNPDAFGSNAVMPMILRGFGIPYGNFGRGRDHLKGEEILFHWAWKDGSRVLTLNQPYHTGVSLAYPDVWMDITLSVPTPATARTAAARVLERLKPRMPVEAYYFPVGVDHMEMRPGMSAILDSLRKAMPEMELVCSDPVRFMETTEELVRREGIELQTASGEMRGSRDRPMSLQGTMSTNLRIKQENRRCEMLLESLLEPLNAVLAAHTGRSEGAMISLAWKTLLRNHCHDSVTACSPDHIIPDVLARTRHVEEIYQIASERMLADLYPPPRRRKAVLPSVALVNTVPHRRVCPFEGLMHVAHQLEGDRFDLVDCEGVVVGEAELLVHRQIDLETYYQTHRNVLRMANKVPREDPRHVYSLYRVRGVTDFGADAAVHTLNFREAASSRKDPFTVRGRTVDNGNVHLKVNRDGSLSLTELRTGKQWRNLCWFEDMADAGNTYDWKRLGGDRPLRTLGDKPASFRVVHRDAFSLTVRVATKFGIPERLTKRGRSRKILVHTLVTEYTLHAGSSMVRARVRFENQSLHHRLRLGFRFPIEAEVLAGGHFAAHHRECSKADDRFPCRPMLDYLHVQSGARGLAVLVRGLYEYETPEPTDGAEDLLVTMIRSVDQQSQTAGWNVPVEHAKELGEHEVEFALAPSDSLSRTIHHADAFRTPVLVQGMLRDRIRKPDRLLSVDNDRAIVSSLKRSIAEDGTIVRLYNPSSEPVRTRLALRLPHGGAEAVNLAEKPLDEALKGKSPRVTIRPHGLMTVKFADPA